MSEKIVQLNEEVIKGQLKELVRRSVEETLNELLEQEAEKLNHAARYERNEARQGYRSGHYSRNLTTTSGDVTLHVPRLRVCLKFFDKREGKADNKGKQAGDEGECDNIQAISAGKSMRRYERI